MSAKQNTGGRIFLPSWSGGVAWQAVEAACQAAPKRVADVVRVGFPSLADPALRAQSSLDNFRAWGQTEGKKLAWAKEGSTLTLNFAREIREAYKDSSGAAQVRVKTVYPPALAISFKYRVGAAGQLTLRSEGPVPSEASEDWDAAVAAAQRAHLSISASAWNEAWRKASKALRDLHPAGILLCKSCVVATTQEASDTLSDLTALLSSAGQSRCYTYGVALEEAAVPAVHSLEDTLRDLVSEARKRIAKGSPTTQKTVAGRLAEIASARAQLAQFAKILGHPLEEVQKLASAAEAEWQATLKGATTAVRQSKAERNLRAEFPSLRALPADLKGAAKNAADLRDVLDFIGAEAPTLPSAAVESNPALAASLTALFEMGLIEMNFTESAVALRKV